MINEIKQDGDARMQKTIEALENAFSRVRTGRAHPGMLASVMVNYYGADTPLNQVASVNVEDSRTLLVQPFERSMVQAVDKAIREADLGLNPMTADVIRVPMPALTEETRRDMQKLARSEAENSRVSIRNVRRDMMNDVKDLAKEKEISEDDERRASDDIQKMTDKYISMIDGKLEKKETELMAV
ncbi:ribosome recycling factor [Psychrobacter arenosus]|jgi:ribosome recycling factor|uniref:ribosome recycling factor n=1 Tax=Psychrobacter arenosus TaxID=256326 RepID=UPI001919CAD8|nr:ribosome recycling factor [Psychrobacter arenosus]